MNALVMYDHQTDTLWSQFLSRGVEGPLAGASLEVLPVLQATWQQWLDLHPDTLVLDKRGRYQQDTYESYYRSNALGILGESNEDTRLPGKELVIGIEDAGQAKAYPFHAISEEVSINDEFAGKPLLVAFDPASETGAAFDRRVGGRVLTFQPAAKAGDGFALLRDKETGSTWQALTGRAIDGTMTGAALTRLPSFYSFWFAWSDFHPETELYGHTRGGTIG